MNLSCRCFTALKITKTNCHGGSGIKPFGDVLKITISISLVLFFIQGSQYQGVMCFLFFRSSSSPFSMSALWKTRFASLWISAPSATWVYLASWICIYIYIKPSASLICKSKTQRKITESYCIFIRNIACDPSENFNNKKCTSSSWTMQVWNDGHFKHSVVCLHSE